MTTSKWESFKTLLTVARDQMLGDDGTWNLHSDIAEAIKRSAGLVGVQPPIQVFWRNELNGIVAKLTAPTGETSEVTLEVEGASLEMNRAFAAGARRKVDRLIDEWLEFVPAAPATSVAAEVATPQKNLTPRIKPPKAGKPPAIERMRTAIAQKGRDALPDTLTGHVKINRQVGRKALRELESLGEYSGFAHE